MLFSFCPKDIAAFHKIRTLRLTKQALTFPHCNCVNFGSQKMKNDSFRRSPYILILNSFFFFALCFSGGHVEVPPPAAGGEQEAGGADQDADHEEGEAAAPQRSAIGAFHPQHGLFR